MKRFQEIIQHKLYQEAYQFICKMEENRKFCLHQMNHFLDVARLAYIFALEQKMELSKDVIYAIALLHDIGRAREYEDKIPHEEASQAMAREILPDCGYTPDEIQVIEQIIGDHRNKDHMTHPFSSYFYEADKLSRNCMECQAYDACYWSEEKKNHTYEY